MMRAEKKVQIIANVQKQDIKVETVPEIPYEPAYIWLELYYQGKHGMGNGCYRVRAKN